MQISSTMQMRSCNIYVNWSEIFSQKCMYLESKPFMHAQTQLVIYKLQKCHLLEQVKYLANNRAKGENA